jgi:hypothetical protein
MGGRRYTENDDKRLKMLIEDNPNVNVIDIARKAIAYGICPFRNENALAQHITMLMTPLNEKAEAEDTQIEWDPEASINKEKALRYDELIDILIDRADLYKGPFFNSLHFDYKAINGWLREKELDRILSKLEALEQEDGHE